MASAGESKYLPHNSRRHNRFYYMQGIVNIGGTPQWAAGATLQPSDWYLLDIYLISRYVLSEVTIIPKKGPRGHDMRYICELKVGLFFYI